VRVIQVELPGVVLIEPDVFRDVRGYFLETYHAQKYREAGIDLPFVQDNQSESRAGSLRGLHLQIRHPQGKLVRVIAGEIFDVAVDVRRGSPTFGRWIGHTLSAQNFRQCYIPPGFAHGFCVLSDAAQVEYKVTDVYDPQGEIGIAWNDPQIAIQWPVSEPVLSDRDRRHPTLAEADASLPVWRP
jgi:dTDP-4-dehydrorhamnose 3,5-epimerase